MRDNVIRRGPRIALWACPSCRERVPRLLPNGRPNRLPVRPDRQRLDHPVVLDAMSSVRGFRANEICYSCDQAYQELLGTLVRPPMEEGDARGAPGLADTGIVGALVPSMQKGTQILIFHVIDGRLEHVETEPIAEFNPDRLTYPGERGAIAPVIWDLYHRHLAVLHAESSIDDAPGD